MFEPLAGGDEEHAPGEWLMRPTWGSMQLFAPLMKGL